MRRTIPLRPVPVPRAPRARPTLLALLAFFALPTACDEDAAGPPTPGALHFADIDVGYLHACAVTLDERAFCWGGNSAGALGTGTLEPSARPVAVDGGHRFVAIDAGAGHTCALDADGVGWCWGHNDEGQLGDGGFVPTTVPTRVDLDAPIQAISAGHAHSCALTGSKEIWCWGDDSAGQIGDGPPNGEARKPTPRRVASPPAEYVDVFAGYYQTCAIDASLHAYCWGMNVRGQNGDGTDSARHVPTAVALDVRARRIAPGDRFACALSSSTVYCWGANRHGELATPAGADRLIPARIGIGDARLVATSMGPSTIPGSEAYACAVRRDDRAVCWGGRVGPLRARDATPAPLDDAVRFSALALGPQFACALDVHGYAWCGGANGSGQLGTGDEEDRARMTPVVRP